MAWTLLPTNYTDAVWNGLKKYQEITNDDGTVSFQDVTTYTNRENSFFGAKDANRMNEALNVLMSMVENGTDLYTAFQNYFAQQKVVFTEKADNTYAEFEDYVADLKTEGDAAINTIKKDYREEITEFEEQQEQLRFQLADLEASVIQPSYSEEQISHLFGKAKELLKNGVLTVRRQVIDQYVDKVIVHPTKVEIYLNVFSGYGVTETIETK
ncbi:MAG: hypothetical protein IKZ03_03840 [Clostridia bacterium]|nr:hypothetical protein [Clostridia bacterium]